MGLSSPVNRISKKCLWIISIIIFCTLTILFTLGTWVLNDSKISSNIFIESVNIGGLTPEEAKTKVKEIFEKEIENFSMELAYNDSSLQLSHKDLGLYYVFDDYITKAYGIGRSGNYYERIKTINSLRKNPKIIKLEPYYDDLEIEDTIDKISQLIYKPAINATIERKDGSFIITKEVLGVEVDKNALKEKIIGSLKNLSNNRISIPVQNISPEIVGENLSNIEDVIVEYSTAFNGEVQGRVENIKLAANSINNTLLMPEEEFSFNESTGPRTADRGYKEALVIVNGEFVPDIGGGICQVSTTLYQAAVRSDLEITSRRNHGLPVGYVPLGHDATVAYGYIDFKFKNNKDHPIYIESFIKGNQVFVKVYGKETNNISIDLKSEVIEVIEPKMEVKKDSNMYLGENKISKNAKKGYRVVTYKIYLQEGKEFKREVISKDYYPPKDGVIIEGTKEL